jgi:predicted type IV restriction endonuclease
MYMRNSTSETVKFDVSNYGRPTRADFVLDQSAHLFTFSLSANHNAGNEKFTPRRAIKYCVFSGFREIQF